MMRWLRDVLRPADRPEPGGLPYSDLYPNLRPVGIRSRAYPPVRFVGASTSPVVLAAANPARRELTIVNDGTANLYVAEGSGVSTTSWSEKLPAGGAVVLESEGDDGYRDVVMGVWDAANGAARITERT